MSKHINVISCGQGGPSLWLIEMAANGLFDCDLVAVADTGDENDMLWSTGKRTTAKEFFEQVTKPLANKHGFDAAFVRANDKSGNPLPPLHIKQLQYNGGNNGTNGVQSDLPLFGTDGGRLNQSCTSKWKIAAIRQEMRRRGAASATVALGLLMDEVHRIKPSNVKWAKNIWPMITIQKLYRVEVEGLLKSANIPYLIRSECDKCPHKNFFRWNQTSEGAIQEAADFEAKVGKGQFFLTPYRIPLIDAIAEMRQGQTIRMFDDNCDSGYCFT